MLTTVEELKNRRNTESSLVPKLKKNGESVRSNHGGNEKTFR